MMTKLAKNLLVMSFAFSLTCLLSACEKKGAMEEAGEKADKAIEKAGDKVEDASEEIEKKAKEIKKSATE